MIRKPLSHALTPLSIPLPPPQELHRTYLFPFFLYFSSAHVKLLFTGLLSHDSCFQTVLACCPIVYQTTSQCPKTFAHLALMPPTTTLYSCHHVSEPSLCSRVCECVCRRWWQPVSLTLGTTGVRYYLYICPSLFNC